jgi:hypothetical protein
MPRTGWTPSIVPYGADQTVYLVVDHLGRASNLFSDWRDRPMSPPAQLG